MFRDHILLFKNFDIYEIEISFQMANRSNVNPTRQ